MKICVFNDPLWGGFDPSHYLQNYDWQLRDIHKATAVQEIRAIVHEGFDLYLNMLDGAWDEARPGIEVVQALERFDVPFTGSDSRFYEPSREMMKRVCHFYGIQAPAGLFVSGVDEIERTLAGLRYPLLVKHPNSYGSIGLTRESRVENIEQLRVQVERMSELYGGALVEEFIEGREFSVLVVDNPDDLGNPITYQPVEFHFPEGESFKHADMKWVSYNKMKCTPVENPALSERLQEMSRQMFLGLNGSGYGRCDIRMNGAGELFVLEINPNGAVLYPPNDPGTADFILQFDPRGHAHFLDCLIRAAFARQVQRRANWEVRFDLLSGFGTYARQPIAAGETIIRFEEQPQTLVSRDFVEKNWDKTKRELFYEHAYPLSGDVFVMWAQDSAMWKPLNHSCDPSAWFSGLDVVARRNIAPGEQITLDYATLFADDMPAFECHCESSNCRGIVRGSDHLEHFVSRYGEHVTAYVFIKRKIK